MKKTINNNRQMFHAFSFNIRNNSPEAINNRLEGFYYENRSEILFRHEKNPVHISFHCGQNEMIKSFDQIWSLFL